MRGGASTSGGRSASGRGAAAGGRAASGKAAGGKAASTPRSAPRSANVPTPTSRPTPPDSFTPTSTSRAARTQRTTTVRTSTLAPGKVPSRALTASFMDASSFAPARSRPASKPSSRALNGAPLGTPNSFVPQDRAVRTPTRSLQPANKNELLGQLQPAGASPETAAQDGLSTRGVMASRTMAGRDLQRMDAYRDRLQEAARQHGLPSAVLAGIASRESRAGLALKSSGFAKFDKAGFGVMQLDVTKNPDLASRKSTPAEAFSQEHFNKAAGLLAKNVETVRREHPDWSEVDVMRGAVAAYNFGTDDVKTLGGLDKGTTGNDYSGDVMARAQYFSERGF